MTGSFAAKKCAGMFMCRWMSRQTLTVTDVRVRRLQDISEEDAIAEGIELRGDRMIWGWRSYEGQGNPHHQRNFANPRDSFRTLWNSINGPDAWRENPYVAVYSFTVEKGNIDAR